jgi:hypothetical protein
MPGRWRHDAPLNPSVVTFHVSSLHDRLGHVRTTLETRRLFRCGRGRVRIQFQPRTALPVDRLSPVGMADGFAKLSIFRRSALENGPVAMRVCEVGPKLVDNAFWLGCCVSG